MQIPEANLRNMLKAISEGNHVLNEQVSFYHNTKSICPTCVFDPIRKESTDRNCPTCSGEGYVITELKYTISASIEQEEDFKYDFSKAGKLLKGQVLVTIDSAEFTTLDPTKKYDLNDYPQMKSFVESFDYIKWKGAKYTVESFEPGWLQGNLYEIAIVLKLVGA
jgi:hypothetical protein